MTFERPIFDTIAIKRDFHLYENIFINFLFNSEKKKYTAKAFYSLIGKPEYETSSLEKTFYDNKTKFENTYNNIFFPTKLGKKPFPTEKLTSTTEYFYHRLKSYLVTSEDVFTLEKYSVTPYFFPLYIAVIYSISKTNNWENTVTSIKSIYSTILTLDHFHFNELPQENCIELYDYWLDLFLPKKLYSLIKKADDITEKELYYPSHSALRYNFALYKNTLVDTIFISKTIQNDFFSQSEVLLNDYLNQRNRGTDVGYTLLEQQTRLSDKYLTLQHHLYQEYIDSKKP